MFSSHVFNHTSFDLYRDLTDEGSMELVAGDLTVARQSQPGTEIGHYSVDKWTMINTLDGILQKINITIKTFSNLYCRRSRGNRKNEGDSGDVQEQAQHLHGDLPAHHPHECHQPGHCLHKVRDSTAQHRTDNIYFYYLSLSIKD